MSIKGKNEKEVDNTLNMPPPPVQHQEEFDYIGYTCSECSSLIEILSINEDKNEISFKCVNNIKHANQKMNINDYLEKMKKFIDKNNLRDKCKNHSNKEYLCYCFNCRYHLCKECIKSKEHKKHNKIYLIELQPNEEDIDKLKNKIETYNNKIELIKKEKESIIYKLKFELKRKIIQENKKFEKTINLYKIKKENEIKKNNEAYKKDIKEIKRKYKEELKLRKNRYEKDDNSINNKYKFNKNKEWIINNNRIKELYINFNNNINKLSEDILLKNLLNIKKLNEIIYRTYNISSNNYYYCTNINNIINNNENQNKINVNEINIENENDKNINCKDVFDNDRLIENKYKNYIISEIKIEEMDINKKIRIINSFEEFNNTHRLTIKKKEYYKYENEKEIKDNYRIKVNNININFNYFYEFKERGNYKIEYNFINTLTKTDFMFGECNLLTYIDLSHFDAKDVTNMRNMFLITSL